MKKENFKAIKTDKSLLAKKSRYFVGDVVLHDISKTIGVADQKVYYAGFKKGARTKVHYHEGSQILLVTKGTGRLVLFKNTSLKGECLKLVKGESSVLKEGDVVHIPKNTLHWHGALGGKDFAHVAFNGFSSKGKEANTMWYDSTNSEALRIL